MQIRPTTAELATLTDYQRQVYKAHWSRGARKQREAFNLAKKAMPPSRDEIREMRQIGLL